MNDLYLEHKFKYIDKVKTKSGKWRYIYTPKHVTKVGDKYYYKNDITAGRIRSAADSKYRNAKNEWLYNPDNAKKNLKDSVEFAKVGGDKIKAYMTAKYYENSKPISAKIEYTILNTLASIKSKSKKAIQSMKNKGGNWVKQFL